MLTFFADLCNEMANSPSLKFSVSLIIDDMEIVAADSQRTNAENMTKLTIASIPQIYKEHAHLLCGPMQ